MVSFCYVVNLVMLISKSIITNMGSAHLSLLGETEVSSPLKWVVVCLLPGWIESLYGGWSG